ncbi:diaminopimelate epimerase [Spiribacter sp. 2438]|uniref:diaminopimelate epimerase n=1 Tax=Spiribacter sp. 2438 TaxID=2666185 RepID=UPI0012B02385|nr:diaminopimelate epimerase [Spiribacter sp. 2438]QGM20833.1 diaminopimelate epimerase [Spiribacter sp. 2438]
MSLAFTKMQGLGNDFVVLEAVRQPCPMGSDRVRAIADRRRGIGCDQVLLAEPATRPEADFGYRIWNADGSEVEHCGNGVRCMARFLMDQGLVDQRPVTLETRDGRLTRVVPGEDGAMQVDMGSPILEPAAIPFHADHRALSYPLPVNDQAVEAMVVSMGNPHAVIRVDEVRHAPVTTLGPALENHPAFPNRVNVGFMEVVAADLIRLRVFERGAGETPACGTGACAAVVAGRLNGWLDPRVSVSLTGGELVIHWRGEGHPVWMTGPAETVFDGRLVTDHP